jgi:hypothetical protein
MTRKEFIDQATIHVNAIETMVEGMPYKGDSCYDSQKVCLLIQIGRMHSIISSVDKKDLEPNADK